MADNAHARSRASESARSPDRRVSAPEGLLGAARSLLGASDPEGVGMREIARLTGVSAAAAYKHFTDKDDLMATVAAKGFDELSAALSAAALEPDPLPATGLAYVQFAHANRGLFRLMFGPMLAAPDRHAALRQAAESALGALERSRGEAAGATNPRLRPAGATMAFVHGVACLMIANVLSVRDAHALVAKTLGGAAPRPN
jgi:AcrR family transcriptional regulator